MMPGLAAALVFSYLTGSIPSSYIAGKVLKGIDIRDYGSGNAGAANTARILGKKAGYCVFAADFIKGFICVLVFGNLSLPGWNPAAGHFQQIASLAAAVTGHIFPVYIRFRGGKGVAPAAGGVTALVPFAFPLCILIFSTVYFITKTVSLASLSAAWSLAVFYIPVTIMLGINYIIAYEIFFTTAALVITWMHRGNIKRLLRGTESRF